MSSKVDRDNNFSFLRLLLAFAVIVSHSPQIITGDYSLEPAKILWGTVTLGGIAVNGFFLVSGYLICMSYDNSRSLMQYLGKRILRIYPAFLVAFAICVAIVGPLAGADWVSVGSAAKQLAFAALLAPPDLPGVFEGLHYQALNGSMWTISYEFRAYLIIAALGVVGLLKLRWAILVLTSILVVANAAGIVPEANVPPRLLFGGLAENVRLLSFFLAGTCFYLFRDRIRYFAWAATISSVVLFACLFVPYLAEPALALLGGYIVFWFAFKAPLLWISRRLKDDVSYGVYLYAWPVQSLIVYWGWTTSHIVVTLIAALVSAILGYASWKLVEQPALRLKGANLPWFGGSKHRATQLSS